MLSAFNVFVCNRTPAIRSISGPLIRNLTCHPNLQPTQRCFHNLMRQSSKSHLFGQSHTERLLLRRWAGSKIPSPPNPTGPSKRIKLKKSDIQRLLAFAKNDKALIWGGIACLVVSSTISMCVPYALGRILDIIALDKDSIDATKAKLSDFCLILCGVFVIGGITNFGRVYLFNKSSIRIIQDIRSRLYRKMLNQEAGWFDTKGTGELVNRLSSDCHLVGNSLSQNLSDGLRSVAMVAAGTGMMMYTSPQLALISMGVVPCMAAVAVFYGRYVRNVTRQLQDRYADIMKTGEERLSNIKTVKVFCKEEQEAQLYLHELLDALKLGYQEVLARASFFGLTGMSGNVIIVSVLYYGGTLVATNELTLGALTSFIMYAGYTAISISGLSNFYTELNKGIGSASRIWEIFDRKQLIPNEGGLILSRKPKGEVIFKDVSFSFPTRTNAPVLKNTNLTISPGSITAVVGRSGSGKTTIATLLLRLYDPQSGIITLDGQDLRDLNVESLRNHIGAVTQEPILFSGTIRENVLYGLPPGSAVSEDDFQRVVKEAHVDEFVNSLPLKWETLVGQRGMLLSGGQKQRVAIARALIRNPSILILDEATSALDAVSEQLVQKAIENITQGRTVLTIAHRLSTIRNASNIVVLDQGGICEHGSYEELIAKDDGVFKNLISMQAFAVPVTEPVVSSEKVVLNTSDSIKEPVPLQPV